jgi:hypothetical protein
MKETLVAKQGNRLSSSLLLQIAVAVFLVTLGLTGIIDYNSDLSQIGRAVNRLFGGTGNAWNLVVAIVELIAGAIVLIAMFIAMRRGVPFTATLIILILWVIRIVFIRFTSNIFEPDLILWLHRLSLDLVIFLALWIVNRRYA